MDNHNVFRMVVPHDRNFSAFCGLKVLFAEPGRAKLCVDLEEHHLNTGGFVHGGLVFTLIDNTAGIAASRKENGMRPTVTLSTDVHFIGTVYGGRIICEAYGEHIGRTTAVMHADVKDEAGKLIASASVTFYYTGEVVPFESLDTDAPEMQKIMPDSASPSA